MSRLRGPEGRRDIAGPLAAQRQFWAISPRLSPSGHRRGCRTPAPGRRARAQDAESTANSTDTRMETVTKADIHRDQFDIEQRDSLGKRWRDDFRRSVISAGRRPPLPLHDLARALVIPVTNRISGLSRALGAHPIQRRPVITRRHGHTARRRRALSDLHAGQALVRCGRRTGPRAC